MRRAVELDLNAQPFKNLIPSTAAATHFPNSQTFGAGNFSVTNIAAGSDGPQGKAYRRVAVTGAFTPPAAVDLSICTVSNYGLSTLSMTIPTFVGRPYSFAVPVRSSIAQKVRTQAQGITASGGGTMKNGSDVTLVPGVWTLLICENWVPLTGTVGLRIDVDTGTAPIAWAAGNTFDLARPYLFAKVALPPTLTDGDSPNWKWLGAASASESVGYRQ